MKSVTEIEATRFKIPNGTSDQFLKGDGTVDETAYLHDIGMNDTHITCTQHNTKNNKIDRRLLLVSVWVPGNETTRTVTYPYGASIGDKWTYEHGMIITMSFGSIVNSQLSININNLGAKRVYFYGTTNFSNDHYLPAGSSAMFVYDAPSNSFKMLCPQSFSSLTKIVAVPRLLIGLNVANIANAFKTTRTVVVSGLTTGACVMLNLNTSALVTAIKDNLPSGQIHTLVLKNTNTTAGACVTLQYGTKTENIDLPAKSYAAVPLIAIDSYVIPLPHTIMTY